MKLVWGKLHNAIAMKVLPRAELTPEEVAEGRGKVLVDLSRSKSGKCVFSLQALAHHDSHAPIWAADGSAPSNSTASNMTAQLYMDRVKADIEEQGIQVEVEVREVLLPAPSPYVGAEEEVDDLSKVDWKKYGVVPPKDDEVN